MKRSLLLFGAVLLCLPVSATLIVAVSTPEGIAVAADSRLNRVTASGDHQVVSDRQTKLIDVAGRYLVALGGKSHLGDRPAWMTTREVAEALADKPVEEFARGLAGELSKIYRERVRGASEPNVRLIVAGYEGDTGRVFEVLVPDQQVTPLSSTRRPRMTWTGDTAIADRLILGIDRRVLDLPRWSEEDRKVLREREYLLSTGDMPVAEAVDLATSTIETCIRMARFFRGTAREPEVFHPTIGGPIDAAVVTPEGVHWVQRKPAY